MDAPDRVCFARQPLTAGPLRDCLLMSVQRVHANPLQLDIRTGAPGQSTSVLWSQVRGMQVGRDFEGAYIDLYRDQDQMTRLYFRDQIRRDRFATALTEWLSSHDRVG